MTDWLSTGGDRADEAKAVSSGVDLIMPGGKKNFFRKTPPAGPPKVDGFPLAGLVLSILSGLMPEHSSVYLLIPDIV